MKPLFKNSRARRKSDFYPTLDPFVIPALVQTLSRDWPRTVWEPACGEGHMTCALEAAGFSVVSTDLNESSFCFGGDDFLASPHSLAPAIITNPPFSLAAEFIEHSFALGVQYLALLLKADYWCAASRLPLFDKHPPQWFMPFTWRLDFTGDGAPPMNCAWFVWEPTGLPAQIRLLRKRA